MGRSQVWQSTRRWAGVAGIALLSLGSLLSLKPSILVMAPAVAQSGGGLVLTGSEGVPVLNYRLDFGAREGRLDRYRLDIPPQNVAVAEVQISMPPNGTAIFDGTVVPEEVRLEVEGSPVELQDVFWNPEFRSLEVVAAQPVAAGQTMTVVMSNVRNPTAGIYRFEGRLLGTEANPIFRFIGNWLITVNGRNE